MSKYSLAKPPLAAGESQAEYSALFAMVVKDYEPCTKYELFLVTRMVNLHWRILRMEHNEAAKLTAERVLLRVGRPAPKHVTEDLAAMKIEFALYKLLNEIRQEFHSLRCRREALALQLNASAYPKLIESDQPKMFETKLAKPIRSAE